MLLLSQKKTDDGFSIIQPTDLSMAGGRRLGIHRHCIGPVHIFRIDRLVT